MRSNPSLPSITRPLWPGVVATDMVLSMGQIELKCVLILNWITWNRTVFDIKTIFTITELLKIELFWYLTVCKQNILILNWIGWIRTIWLNWLAWNRNVFDN